MTSVLFVVSAANGWTLKDGSVHPTGFWADELATPHRLFREAGWDIAIATPGGVTPTVDEASLGVMGGTPSQREQTTAYLTQIGEELDRPLRLEDVDEADYDLVFYPGGHGPMEDLAHDPSSGLLIARRMDAGAPIAFLCHGPAAVFASKAKDGTIAVRGRTMTGFSDAEEKLVPAARKAKWTLESQLKHNGVAYEKAAIPMRPHVVVDGNLYTGQNPASAQPLAEQLIEDLGAADR